MHVVAGGSGKLGAGNAPLFVRRRRTRPCAPWPESKPGYQYASALPELRWLLRQAGVPPADAEAYSWHSLRRGAATRLLAMGVPWDVVKKLGGWAADASLVNYDARGRDVAAAVLLADTARHAPGAYALMRPRGAGGGRRGRGGRR